jgi:LysM repeat protein
MNFSELIRKRVAGVPVTYLAAAAVLVLAIVAWRMKPSTPPPADEPIAGDPDTELPTEGDPYGGLATQGTVTVVQQPAQTAPVIEKTNETWVKEGAEWIVAHPTADLTASGTAAVSALNRFLQGEDLSYEEGRIVNAVIREKGQPPDGTGSVGKISDAPGQKQFTNFPGKHTVKGVNDNTPAKLSTLYYGTADALHVNKLVAANTALGPATGSYSVGTKVTIPVYFNPRYFTVTKATTYPSQVAAKNGITYQQLIALNPGLAAPYKVGTKVRVL